MTRPPTLAELMADPGEMDIACLDCHHNTTMAVAALLRRYAAETPFPEVRSGFGVSTLLGLRNTVDLTLKGESHLACTNERF
jgi:hypothetical protein